jgi:tetratricopeptide (TPR) repeat protein
VQRLATAALRRAIDAYARALERQPTEPYTQLGHLVAHHRLATLGTSRPFLDLQEGAALAVRIATLAPTTTQIHYDLGAILLAWDTSQPENASLKEQRGIAALPFFRRVLHLDTSFYPQVLRAYRSSLPQPIALARFASTIPNTPHGYLKAAQTLEPDFWPQARLYYRVALTLAPTDPAILRAYATALQHHREFAPARELWQQLVQGLPGDASAYVGLVEAYSGLNDQQGLVQTLQELVRHFPRQTVYYRRLAEAYIHLGLTAHAEAVWQQLVTILPHDATGYVHLARLYESQHDTTAALTMMQRAVNCDPDNLEHYRYLAQLYQQYGDRAQAMRTMERLADLSPGDAAVRYQLGEYFRQEGEPLQALRYYRRALQLQPNQETYRQAVERLEKQWKSGVRSQESGVRR